MLVEYPMAEATMAVLLSTLISSRAYPRLSPVALSSMLSSLCMECAPSWRNVV